MKLSRYNIFSIFKLFESLLEIDSDLFQLLKYMETSSTIAASLVRIITSRKDLKISQNYLKPTESNDELNFLNDGQGQRAKEAGEDPFSKKGNVAKIGRVVRQILIANEEKVSDSDIEKFVNLYKSTWNKKYAKSDEKMRIVSGEDIRFWYNEKNYNKGGGTLNNSCMRYEVTQEFLDIYVHNPESCKLLIYVDDNNDLVARAIVWKIETPVNGSNIYLDRIYYTHDHMQRTMYDFAANKLGTELDGGPKYINSHFAGNSGVIKVKLQKAIFKKYPYMDSIFYLYPENLTLSNSNSLNGPYVRVRTTSGTPETVCGFVISYYAKGIFRERDCRFIDRRNDDGSIIMTDWVPKDQLVYADGNDEYGFKDEVVYIELYERNYLKYSLVESEWGLVPKDNLRDIYKIEGGAIVFLKKYPGILLEKDDSPYITAPVNNYGVIWLEKEDCVPPIMDRDGWVPKLINLRRSPAYRDFYQVESSHTELNGIKIEDVPGNYNMDKIGSIPKGYSIVDRKLIVDGMIRISAYNEGYRILAIKLDHGHYPIGFYYNNKLFCDKPIVEYFNLKAIETRWSSLDKFEKIVYRAMFYKEVMSINSQIKGSLKLEGMFDHANSYLSSNISGYSNHQVEFEFRKIPDIKEFVVDKFTKAIHNKDHYGYDFEEFLILDETTTRIRSFYRSNGQSFTFFGKREMSVEDWKEALQKCKKAIALRAFLYAITGDRDSNRTFSAIVRSYGESEFGFTNQMVNGIIIGEEFFRHLCYQEVSGDFGRYLRLIKNDFEKYRTLIYREITPETSKGMQGIIFVFKKFWENHEELLN